MTKRKFSLLWRVIMAAFACQWIPFSVTEAQERSFSIHGHPLIVGDRFRPGHERMAINKDYSDTWYGLLSNKPQYLPGEPVFVRYYIGNDKKAIDIRPTEFGTKRERQFWLCQILHVADRSGNAFRKTRLGEKMIPQDIDYTDPKIRGVIQESDFDRPLLGLGTLDTIFPREGFEGATLNLSSLYDVSTEGAYRAEYTQYVAIWDPFYSPKLYDPPKRSNPVSFRVTSGPAFASSGLKKPGKWDNPANDPLEHAPVTNSPKRFFELPPEGDYSKLKLILRSNKAKHGADEPVFVRIFLKNESETEVPVCLEPSGFWGDARFSVTDSQGDSVPKTRLGKKRFPIENRPENGIDWIFFGPGFVPTFVKIPPGREIEIGPGEILLNLFYDISLPGKYRLQIARSTLLPGQVYENPLESNELLLDTRGPALRPEDLLEPGNFETKSLP